MPTQAITGDPTALQVAGSDIDAGDYYLQNQGGEPVRIFEGDSAPSPDSEDGALLQGKSIDRISDLSYTVGAGNTLYAWTPNGRAGQLWFNEV